MLNLTTLLLYLFFLFNCSSLYIFIFHRNIKYFYIFYSLITIIFLRYFIYNFTVYGVSKKINNCSSALTKLIPIVSKNKKYIKDDEKYHNYKLKDFYIFSSHNTYVANNQNMDLNSLEMLKIALKLGIREIELDVYAKNWLGTEEEDFEPYVTHGVMRRGLSDIFLNRNILYFQDCLNVIKENKNPLIINIELNTHYLKNTNNKIIKSLEETFGDNLYFPKNNDRKFLEDEKIGNLIDKVIVVIHKIDKYNDLYTYSHDYRNEDSGIDNNIGVNYTKNKLVRIYPKADIKSHFSYNFDPIKYWNNGVQIVSCNIQCIDIHMKEHFKKFKKYSFVLKPKVLRN
jgi:hypothetical protein